jgi:hypothetical protein
MSNHLPGSIFDKIVNLYKEAVKRLPAIKYSWGLVAIISILSLINFFKLGDIKVVFRSANYEYGNPIFSTSPRPVFQDNAGCQSVMTNFVKHAK